MCHPAVPGNSVDHTVTAIACTYAFQARAKVKTVLSTRAVVASEEEKTMMMVRAQVLWGSLTADASLVTCKGTAGSQKILKVLHKVHCLHRFTAVCILSLALHMLQNVPTEKYAPQIKHWQQAQ